MTQPVTAVSGDDAPAPPPGSEAAATPRPRGRGGAVGASDASVAPRWALHRRLYDWTLSFAHKPNATPALASISFAESSFFPIPPDVLLAPLCLGSRSKAMWFALVTTVASVLGAFLGYAIGSGATEVAYLIPGISEEAITALQAEFEARGQWYVFVAGLTPIPFKLLTITAGAAKMNLVVFAFVCLISRGMRFFGVAGLFWLVGPRATPLIDRYFNHLSIAFVVMLVGGFALVTAMHGDDEATSATDAGETPAVVEPAPPVGESGDSIEALIPGDRSPGG